MDKVRLGNSSLEVSRLTLGCWTFGSDANSYWGAQEKKDSIAMLLEAVDRGVNFFDTAFSYNDGEAESALGEAVQECGLRDRMIICSKIPRQSWEQLPEYEKKVTDSLSRLRTDHLDVLLMHWPCNDKDLLRANLEALQKVKEKGLVREIGISNFGVGQMEIALETGMEPCVNELGYNLISRGIELAVMPYTKKHNIGIMAYMPLMQGILTGKYTSIEEIPILRRRTVHFDSTKHPEIVHGGKGMEKELNQFLADLKTLSEESGISCAKLSIGWILAHDAVTTVLAGSRTSEQLRENVSAVETRLPQDVVAKLDEISTPLFDMYGPDCDLWRWNSRIW